jgi:hypothetical protein
VATKAICSREGMVEGQRIGCLAIEAPEVALGDDGAAGARLVGI